MRRRLFGLGAALLITVPRLASAQLWTALDTVPHPNAIIAHDTSVTMGINTGCTNCHNQAQSRLEASKQDILATLPLFEDYFTFGAFQYSGCDFAKVTGRVLPTPDAPEVSYGATVALIAGASSCGSKEERLPGGGVTTCATAGCGGDTNLVVQLANLALPGFDPLAPFLHVNCAYSYVGDFLPCEAAPGIPTDAVGWRGGCYHVGCSDIGGIEGIIFALNQLPTIEWPRWTQSGVTPQQVRDELCAPVQEVLENVYQQILACRPENEFYSTFPQQINSQSWCVPGLIAQNACVPGSVLYNTCVCDNSNPACISGGNPTSDCGTPFTWKARQQVAVCESYQPGGAFDSFYESQPDNVVNGECRENAVLFFTDGYMGHTPGTVAEGGLAIPTYRSVSGLSNMAVFRISDVFADQANQMMSAVTGNAVPAAYSALDEATMQESFSRLLNRIYKGVYAGNSMTMDSQGTSAVFHSFTVPGYNAAGPVSDNYLGWPARLSMYRIDYDGTNIDFVGPVWETDWASKVGSPSGCGPTVLGNDDVARLGPGGTFRNGVQRTVNIGASSVDRDGDGAPDTHQALELGSMYSIAATRPVIVEAPREAPNGKYGADFITFQSDPQIRERPRAVYVMGNGYVHGFHGGRYTDGNTDYGLRKISFSYEDGAEAGTEILRYGPTWVTGQGGVDYRYDVNDLIQQPLTTGELVAREMRISVGGGYEFRTVLVGAQGKEGRGFFALDVTNPCAPSVLSEWQLPAGGDRASGEPMLYYLPNGANDRAVVITTGGLGGSPNLYAFDIVTGAQVTQLALPGGSSYIASPICLDARGEGRLTHCYVLREDGMVLRANVEANGQFNGFADITPPGVVGGNRRFTTSPAVFFDPSGNPNLVFGSGDFERLTQNGPQNSFYKIIDRGVRTRNIGNNPADIQRACGTLDGVIDIGPNERVISPPFVGKGIVAFTTYTPNTNACASGQAKLYAMNYLTCSDAVDGQPQPQPTDIGDGLPSTPVLHRDSQKLLGQTSAGPTADQVTEVDVATKGGNRTWVKRLYWRPVLDAR
jgi:hypothetical protein